MGTAAVSHGSPASLSASGSLPQSSATWLASGGAAVAPISAAFITMRTDSSTPGSPTSMAWFRHSSR